MIEHWMLSVLDFGVVIAIGGTCLGHITSRLGLSRRWLWLALMAISVALPVVLAMRTVPPELQQSAEYALATPALRAARPGTPINNTMLLAGWGLLSACLAALFLASHRRTLAQMSVWKTRELLGSSVTISPDFGPAAVGFVRSRVVLPEWVLALPEAEQSLVLRHELEHIKSGDQYALLAGVMMVVMMPWNLGLWWQFRRLRIGMELDCDARVAPALRDRPRYADLLLRARDQRHAYRPALAMAPAPSALSERLMALLERGRPSSRQLTAWSFSAVACSVMAAQIRVPNLIPLLSHGQKQQVIESPTVGAPAAAVRATQSDAPVTTKQRRVSRKADVAPPVNPTPRYDILIPYVQGAPGIARGTLRAGGGRGGISTGAAPASGPSGSIGMMVRVPPDSTQHR